MSTLIKSVQSNVKAAQAANPAPNTASPVKTVEKQAVKVEGTPPVAQVEAKPELKPWETVKHKIKVNDVEQELDYQDLINRAQKGMGADSKYQEAAAMRKQAETALRMLKEDPTKAYKLLGIDNNTQKQWAIKYLEEQAVESMLTPEQKAARDERNQLLSAAQELEALKKEKQQTELAQRQAVLEQQLGDKIVTTLDSSGLPKTREVVKRIAQKMLTYREAGFKQVTPQDVIDDVKQEYQSDLKAMLGGSAEDQLEAFLGDETVQKLIASRNKKIVAKNSPFTASPKGNTKKVDSKGKDTKKEYKGNQWRSELENKFKK